MNEVTNGGESCQVLLGYLLREALYDLCGFSLIKSIDSLELYMVEVGVDESDGLAFHITKEFISVCFIGDLDVG
jgi:hypothetical protein